MQPVGGPCVVHEHADWSSRRVTLVCGPPGSGKSTWARANHDKVIEVEGFDDAPSIREKLRRYGLAVSKVGKRSWTESSVAVVRCAASAAEREHHERLCRPSLTVVLLTPPYVCHENIDNRGSNRDGEHEAVDAWWATWTAEHE